MGSLPRAMWFIIVTMTTVGYGDLFPETNSGRSVASVLIIGSLLYMAIPLGIVGNAFSSVWEDRDRLLLLHRTRKCLLQWGYAPQDIPALFYIFDKDKDGQLCLPEFCAMLSEMKIGLDEQRMISLFKTFDADESGLIDDEE